MSTEWSNGESASEEGQLGTPDPGSELRELEDELCRLGGVLAVRVVGDRTGRPVEVHVLSDTNKPPKQTVRDVRAVAQTMFGIELDHRIVSVAQLDTNESDTPVGILLSGRDNRIRLGGVHADSRRPAGPDPRRRSSTPTASTSGTQRVRLRRVARPQLVGTATLDALRQIEPAADAVHLAGAEITRVGSSKRRSRHRRLRRAADGARRVGLGDRATRS